jgi:hypothetical protein
VTVTEVNNNSDRLFTFGTYISGRLDGARIGGCIDF